MATQMQSCILIWIHDTIINAKSMLSCYSPRPAVLQFEYLADGRLVYIDTIARDWSVPPMQCEYVREALVKLGCFAHNLITP